MEKNVARESGLAKKIVRNEGTEKKFLNIRTPTENHPPPNQKLNGRPLRLLSLYIDQWLAFTHASATRIKSRVSGPPMVMIDAVRLSLHVTL